MKSMKSCGMPMKSMMPKGGKQSPSGDLGALRQAESMRLGKFKGAKSVSPASQFKGRKKKS